MQDIELNLTLPGQEWITGAAFRVNFALTNRGAAAFDAPATYDPSIFEFVFQPSGPASTARLLSAQAAARVKYHDPAPFPQNTLAIAPGGELKYSEDLAEYALPAVPAGKYKVSVTLSRNGAMVKSAPLEITVLAPRVGSLGAVVGRTDARLASVLIHMPADGPAALLQRESTIEKPFSGTLFRRAEFPDGNVQAAVAAELYPNRGVRWFGWLRNGSAGGGVAQDATLFATAQPVAIPLRNTKLFGTGWQPKSESAMFAVLGEDERGKVSLAWVTLQAAAEGSVRTAALAETVMPSLWAVRYRSLESMEAIDVVISHETGDKTLLVRQSVLPDGTVAPPVKVGEGQLPLAALAMDSIATGQAGVVDALFGPAEENRVMTLQRFPLDGGDAIANFTFSLGKLEPGEPQPEQWTLANEPLADPVVFYKSGDRLLSRRIAENSPRVVSEDAAHASHLRVFVVKREIWLLWADPVKGLVFHRL